MGRLTIFRGTHQFYQDQPIHWLLWKSLKGTSWKLIYILGLTLFYYNNLLNFMTTLWQTYLCNVYLIKCALPYKQILRYFNLWLLWRVGSGEFASRMPLSPGKIHRSPAQNGTPAVQDNLASVCECLNPEIVVMPTANNPGLDFIMCKYPLWQRLNDSQKDADERFFAVENFCFENSPSQNGQASRSLLNLSTHRFSMTSLNRSTVIDTAQFLAFDYN